jgi:hypothetical protein
VQAVVDYHDAACPSYGAPLVVVVLRWQLMQTFPEVAGTLRGTLKICECMLTVMWLLHPGY